MDTTSKKRIGPGTFTSLHKIIHFVWDVKPLQASLLCLLTIMQAIVPALNLWIGKLIIDGVVQGMGKGVEAFYGISYYLVILLGINFFSNLISSASTVIQALLGDVLAHKINVKVIEKSTSLDLFFYDNSRFYDKLSRAQREASSRPVLIVSTLFKLIQNLITMISMIAILIALHWGTVAILIIVAIPQLVTQAKFAERGYSLLFSQTQDSRKLFYFSHILTGINHFKEIKLFNLGPFLLERYRKVFFKTFYENKKLVIKKNISSLLISLLSAIAYVLVYGYVIFRTINGDITLGDLTLYSGAYSRSQGLIASIISNLSSLYENNLFINNLFTFLNLTPMIKAPKETRPLPGQISRGIEFRDVGFKYPEAENWVLRNFNLRINPGENIALVGDNGAGKTTFVKLLSRLYDPLEGEILLDGINIKEFDPKKYQDLIGVTFQDFSQFFLTARENVGIGNIDEVENMTRIEAAASKSGAHKVIEKLPMSYESLLGRYFDDGCQLSIGEWQKIAISRAFMRDSKILILDEPTASLDAKTEYEIFQHFKELTLDKLSILISHRFSTVRMSDRIYVVEKGKIAEVGTHEQLMQLEGKYAAMFNMQAEHYREPVMTKV